MSEVLAAITNGIFAVLVLVLGVRLNSKVNKVKDQVVNGHKTNLRVEFDDRHTESNDKLDTIVKEQKRQGGEITRMRASIAKLWDRSYKHTDQIHDLEITGPRPNLTGRTRKKGN